MEEYKYFILINCVNSILFIISKYTPKDKKPLLTVATNSIVYIAHTNNLLTSYYSYFTSFLNHILWYSTNMRDFVFFTNSIFIEYNSVFSDHTEIKKPLFVMLHYIFMINFWTMRTIKEKNRKEIIIFGLRGFQIILLLSLKFFNTLFVKNFNFIQISSYLFFSTYSQFKVEKSSNVIKKKKSLLISSIALFYIYYMDYDIFDINIYTSFIYLFILKNNNNKFLNIFPMLYMFNILFNQDMNYLFFQYITCTLV